MLVSLFRRLCRIIFCLPLVDAGKITILIAFYPGFFVTQDLSEVKMHPFLLEFSKFKTYRPIVADYVN